MEVIFLLLVALFAWAEHIHDGVLIDLGIEIDRKAHAKRFRFRAGVVILCAMPFAGPYGFGLNWLILLKWALMCIAAGFLFSSVFRYLLNKRRGKHWAYISPSSSTYDAVFFEVADMFARIVHSQEVIARRGGRIGYAFEILVTLAALIGVAVSNN